MERNNTQLEAAKLTARMTEALLALVLEAGAPVTVTTAQIGEAVKQGRQVRFCLGDKPGELVLSAEQGSDIVPGGQDK